jgi:TPR repeat protein
LSEELRSRYEYGICLWNRQGVSVDLIQSTNYFKLVADQADAQAQSAYRNCLSKGEGVSTDLIESAYCFKFAADQGFAEAQRAYCI